MSDEEKKITPNDVGKKVLEYLEKGLKIGQKGLKTAGNAVSDFSDKSVHKIEIQQLKSKLNKQYSAMGVMLYENLLKNDLSIESLRDQSKDYINSIEAIKEEIKKHEAAITEGSSAADNNN